MNPATHYIVERLLKGDASCLTQDVIYNINKIVMSLYPKENLTQIELDCIDDILHISNIIYNNTDKSILVLEDGIYDMLLEKYKKYNPNFQVGAEPVNFSSTNNDVVTEDDADNTASVFVQLPWVDTRNFMFGDSLNNEDLYGYPSFSNQSNNTITKRLRNTSHKYPKLVGTLHKAKFVLDNEAMQKGVYEDTNVKIFERDFLRKHVQEGIVNPNNITLVLELKYDGVSIEAEVTDRVLSARTRGETQMDKASDLTPILGGYTFNKAMGYDITPFGMKFEAVISYANLRYLNLESGNNYVNARNAIIGILGNSNAVNLAKYITLVPLQTSHDNMNRVQEIEFMNKYYSTGEFLRYTVVSGNYNQVLYMVDRFVKEAEQMRDVMPFMYDGVVVSYLDEGIRIRLGRKNYVNEYSLAIKFNTKKKLTRVRNITYTVGANGDITPMIHYDPVEFYGMINTKSSGHSYARFKELNLKPNEVITIEFVNDVMAYIKPANVEENMFNPNRPFEFIKNCPECGCEIEISDSGKKAICPNPNCPARVYARMTNMLSKLGFKGFSTETIKKLNIVSFYDFMTLSPERVKILGEVNSINLLQGIEDLHTRSIADYIILGSIGFTGIASSKWKAILQTISLQDIIKDDDGSVFFRISNGKNLGPSTAETIVKERQYFMKDLVYIYNMPNVVFTKDTNEVTISMKKKIRFSGIRDEALMNKLCAMGHDCSENSVTKDTDILLIPYVGYNSTKVSKAMQYNTTSQNHQIRIIPLDEFRLNESSYLEEI